MSDIYDEIETSLSGQGKSVFNADTAPGTSITGTITGVDYVQQVDYQTKQPAVFPSGDAKMQYVIRLHVPELVNADDDGARAVYIKAWGPQKTWFNQAIKDTGLTPRQALAVGNQFTVTFVRKEHIQGKTGSYNQKIYAYRITPAVEASLQQPAPATAQAPAQAPAAYQAPTPVQPSPQPQQPNGIQLARDLYAKKVPMAEIVKATGFEEHVIHAIVGDY